MQTLGSYLLQMACWLAGFWLVYVAVLRKETFFGLNRWFLLFGLVASLTLPFFPLHYTVVRPPVNFEIVELTSSIEGTPTASESKINYWLVAYCAGVVGFLLRFLWQSIKLYHLRRRGERLVVGKTLVFKLDKATVPFSFFNSIYISKNLCGDTELKTVVAHEKVHIDERHWADLLLLEVARAMQWFNPLLILYRKAIMQNHEFLADSGALQRGVCARTYKAVLANQMLGMPVFQVASGFTLFNSTKRILMMNKDKTSPAKRLKLLWALPVVAILLVAFAKPNYVQGESPTQATELSNPVTVKGKILDQWGNPVSGAKVATADGIQQTISDTDGNFQVDNAKSTADVTIAKEGYTVVNKIEKSAEEVVVLAMKESPKEQQAKTITVKGKVTDEKGNPLPGTNIVEAQKGTGRYISGSVTDKDGNYVLGKVNPENQLQFSFVGYETQKVNVKEVVNVSLKQAVTVIAPPPPPPPFVLKGKNGEKPLVVVDGKIYTKDFSSIAPETIESIEVLKDPASTSVYGDKGKDGVVVIKTKKGIAPPPPPPLITQVDGVIDITTKERALTSQNSKFFEGILDGKRLLLVDGQVSTRDIIENIDLSTIESVEVLKEEWATSIYGDKGKDGVVLVKTKKNIAPPPPPSKDNQTANITIKGKVTNEKGEPLIGASIVEVAKGSGRFLKGTTTDSKGNYVLGNVNEDNQILISFFGYERKNAEAKTDLNVTLKQSIPNIAPPPLANDEVFVVVEEEPEFPGGSEAFGNYLSAKLSQYKQKGFAEVRFLVDKDGKVKDVKAVSTESEKLNKIAEEIIAGLPRWKPGMQRGKAVPVLMQIGLDFETWCITKKLKFAEEK